MILAGGLVTSHEAGLAVPDWPLSYGKIFPPMVGNIFWEHGHRMIAGGVALMTLIQAVWIQREESRIWLRRLAWVSVLAVLLQAALGGITVLFLLPPAVSIAHATLAQTFFCLMLTLAFFLAPKDAGVSVPEDGETARARRLVLLTAGLIYCQLMLGAAVRHTGHALAMHIVLAVLILLHVGLVVRRLFSYHDIGPAALILGLLTVIQFFLGIGSWITTRILERGYQPQRIEVAFTAAHQTLGAVILGLTVLIALNLFFKSCPAPKSKQTG
ncbi:MAG: hypothetical protein A2Z83_03000 [Omnitrophica bacterium GWA2_52_8]|nr:MAG: hypothetical protein A2Z83_03000 [Omnitrophica bacterium GWA2_52_8]